MVAQDRHQCCAAAYDTRNVSACYSADGSPYYRRGSTQTSFPPPHWLKTARLGQSSAQQVSAACFFAERASTHRVSMRCLKLRQRQPNAVAA